MPTWWIRFKSWPKAARWSSYCALALVLVLVAVLIAGTVVLRRPLPETSGQETLPGLSGSVEVIRDGNGIPQIYADTTSDLLRAQGYVAAQDRFWEMDIRRHITAGRLSELFGEQTLETDKVIRTMGWRQVAEREVTLVSPQTRQALEDYAAGVNAYLEQRSPSQLAVQYTLLAATGLSYTPEPWTPVDSLSWLKAMAWDLRGNMQEEIERALIGVNHSDAQVDQLFPDYPLSNGTIVSRGALVDGVYEPAAKGGTREDLRPAWTADQVTAQVAALESAASAVAAVPALVGQGDGLGSNSWVVSGEHTTTGQPLLADDPHLGVSQPGIWMQIGLHCRQVSAECPFDVAGFTFSGIPGVVIGHNADIAWGFTNLGPDVSDLYLEKTDGARWWYDGKYRPLAMRTETISVRDGEPFTFQVRSTDHGPLISDTSAELSTVGANAAVPPGRRAIPDRGNGYAVALQWTALQPSATADAILDLNQASNWNEFRAAAARFDVPAQNIVYADREGHIGYQAPGRIPVRKSGNAGLVPAAGWLPENDWTGTYLPFESLPTDFDPPSGIIATANQAVVGPDYPNYLTHDWDYGFRAARINELLAAATADGQKISPEQMAAIQLDEHSELAERIMPYLLAIPPAEGYDGDGQRLLPDWDFTMSADSAAAAYFAVVWRNILELTFQDEMRESMWPDGGSRYWQVVLDLLKRPDDPWWNRRNTTAVETRDDILREALIKARDDLTRLESLSPEDWAWGRLHRLDLTDQTLGNSGIGVLEQLLNRTGYQIGGGGSIVNATSWNAGVGFEVTAAPSMRMVVDLADFDASRWINLTGVSGHPASDHYDDQTPLFVAGETLPWAYTRDAVEASSEDRLTLTP